MTFHPNPIQSERAWGNVGTRGFIGFVADGQEKIQYNQFDMYPDGHGVQTLQWLRNAAEQPHVLGAAVRRLRVVEQDSEPTPEDIERLAKYADLRVSTRQLTEWYVLLRSTQGDPQALLEAGVVEDASSFPLDSLFCEYGYLVDLDGDGWFEVYRGFQTCDHDRGRFADRAKREDFKPEYPGAQYYAPVALWHRWPLAALPADDEFLAALSQDGEEA